MRRTRTVDKCSAQNDDAGKERGCEEAKERRERGRQTLLDKRVSCGNQGRNVSNWAFFFFFLINFCFFYEFLSFSLSTESLFISFFFFK